MSSYLKLVNTIGGSGRRVHSGAAAPVDGTDEVQTLTVTGTPTGGTFTLSFGGATTAPIAYNAAAAAVQSALEALATVGTGGVVAGGGALPGTPVTLTFAGNLGKRAQPLVTADGSGLTGGTTPDAAVAETTPGVDATLVGHPANTLYVDESSGDLYVNAGTANDPTWTLVGGQT